MYTDGLVRFATEKYNLDPKKYVAEVPKIPEGLLGEIKQGKPIVERELVDMNFQQDFNLNDLPTKPYSSNNYFMPKEENIPFKFMNCAVLAKT